MVSLHDLTTAQLREALECRENIESLQQQLNAILGSLPAAATARRGRPPGKRKMSAATIEKMRAAQQARASSKTPTRKKKVMSPEARAKIAAAQKARWAAKRKASVATM